MKCYILDNDKSLVMENLKQEEVNKETEELINNLCSKWQVRDLNQSSGGSLYADEVSSYKNYEPLKQENLVIQNGVIVGYYAVHFNITYLVKFSGNEEKVDLGDYDLSDYSGSGKINRGHVTMVHKPDNDTNPYADQPRFHSQEEYDDYIKWKD